MLSQFALTVLFALSSSNAVFANETDHPLPAPAAPAKEKWKKLPPKDRQHAVENYRRFKRLSPEKQAKIRKKYEEIRKNRDEAESN